MSITFFLIHRGFIVTEELHRNCHVSSALELREGSTLTQILLRDLAQREFFKLTG